MRVEQREVMKMRMAMRMKKRSSLYLNQEEKYISPLKRA